ncbi:hypothetical protein GCM10023205_53780 [Yinghuangia aomiensis]|uniref:Histidine kinase/HSP90-like ATPase domain-containing protein n=1 Tax=Yinghuangia aomiensis TaxID=676205 RepID=A0ABP9HU59_9ACTN
MRGASDSTTNSDTDWGSCSTDSHTASVVRANLGAAFRGIPDAHAGPVGWDGCTHIERFLRSDSAMTPSHETEFFPTTGYLRDVRLPNFRAAPTTVPTGDATPWQPARVVHSLAHSPASAAAARRLARTALTRWRVDDDSANDILTIASELITNAIQHALPGAVTLRLFIFPMDRRQCVRIEVGDGGPNTDASAELVGEHDEHGRGNVIVTCLSARTGSYRSDDGMTYWAEVPVA